jgi:mercuric ion binding protein
MIKMKTLITLAALIVVPFTASAEQQTVKLKVDGMSCSSCPYQVKSALKRVEGVIAASASLDTKEAEVTFDDAVTDIAALTEATANAGFPSTLIP